MAKNEFMSIREFQQPAFASMARDMLEAEGIETQLVGMNHRSVLGVIGTHVPITMRVRERDAQRAAGILEALNQESEEFRARLDADEFGELPASELASPAPSTVNLLFGIGGALLFLLLYALFNSNFAAN